MSEKNQQPPVIAIDGPSGAGKGTVAKILATKLGWHLLDSGSLYRLTGLACIQQGINFDDVPRVAEVAESLDVEFVIDAEVEGVTPMLAGEDVGNEIRNEEIGMAASKVAKLAEVRAALLNRQRAFARSPGLVADGRDMGTEVFTDAPVKIYLTASVEARAKRRLQQLSGNGQLIDDGQSDSLARLVDAIADRDKADMERTVAPLRPAEDSVEIDSTDLSIDQVCELVLSICNERGVATQDSGA